MNVNKRRYWLKKIINSNKWSIDKDGWMNLFSKNFVLSVTAVKNDYKARCLWVVVKKNEVVVAGGPEGVRIAHGDAGSITGAKDAAVDALVNYVIDNEEKANATERSDARREDHEVEAPAALPGSGGDRAGSETILDPSRRGPEAGSERQPLSEEGSDRVSEGGPEGTVHDADET